MVKAARAYSHIEPELRDTRASYEEILGQEMAKPPEVKTDGRRKT